MARAACALAREVALRRGSLLLRHAVPQAKGNRRDARPPTGAPSWGNACLKALEEAGQSLGVRALSSELGVAPDLLSAPLLELRAAGRIAKHGEKRATTYSLA